MSQKTTQKVHFLHLYIPLPIRYKNKGDGTKGHKCLVKYKTNREKNLYLRIEKSMQNYWNCLLT